MDLIDTTKTLLGPPQSSPEWQDLRFLDEDRNPPFVLGASDAGVVGGVDKYKTRLELYHEILGNVEPREQNEPMYWGVELEEPILKAYERRTHTEVYRPRRLYQLSSNPFIAATPDGIGLDDQGRFCVEAKTASGWMFSRENCRERDCFGEGDDEVPMSYLMQAHQQMLVLDCERVDMPVLFDGRELRIYNIHRNPVITSALLHDLQEFYIRVLGLDPPEPDFEHDSTLDFLKKVYGISPGAEMTLPQDSLQWYDSWTEAKREIDAAEAKKNIAQAHLLQAMAECERCFIPEHNTELRRTQIEETRWTQRDITDAQANQGAIKRKRYVRFTERKVTQ